MFELVLALSLFGLTFQISFLFTVWFNGELAVGACHNYHEISGLQTARQGHQGVGVDLKRYLLRLALGLGVVVEVSFTSI